MNSAYQFGLPPQPPGFNYMDSLRALNVPMSAPNVPYSPVSANGTPAVAPNGAAAPAWNNPFAYQAWDASSGFGDYIGANAPLFMGGMQTLSGGLQAYTGLKGLSLAQNAFRQGRKEFNINLSNQTQSYNTQVSDRIAGRHYATEAERQAALAAAQLVDRSKYGKGG